jgi:hypothetical protein
VLSLRKDRTHRLLSVANPVQDFSATPMKMLKCSVARKKKFGRSGYKLTVLIYANKNLSNFVTTNQEYKENHKIYVIHNIFWESVPFLHFF